MIQPRFRLRVPEELKTVIRGLHPEIKRKLKGSLKIIVNDPYVGKELKEELWGLRSFRVSRFRIIYRITPKAQIELIAVGPRRAIYDETFKRIKMEKNIAT